MKISWNVTKQEARLIAMIAERACELRPEAIRMNVEMDITGLHANGTRLRLRELLAADDFNFLHDVIGIERHLDRATATLNHFHPRFAQ